jgi:23S rRNA (adenine2503-C2)-methyltransferase
MKLLKRIKSKKDNTVKYIFQLDDGLLTEFSYINKNDGKDIICCSSQTYCDMGCKFCHLTGNISRQKRRNLYYNEIPIIIDFILKYTYKDPSQIQEMLLLSFMGIGEPLFNLNTIIKSHDYIRYAELYKRNKVAISTMVPKDYLYELSQFKLPFDIDGKIHYSLHFMDQLTREIFMPQTENFKYVIPILKKIRDNTNTKIELHYTLIKGINDSEDDMTKLAKLELPVKFLQFNPKDNTLRGVSEESYNRRIKPILDTWNTPSEYYIPPGRDIGASCGQISINKYL